MPLRRFFKILLIGINIFIGCGLAFCALVTHLDAQSFPRLVIAAMSFPVWVPPTLLLLVIDFFFLRKWCLWISACAAVALPMIFTVLPLNIPRDNVPDAFKKDSWTLLSYNIVNYNDMTMRYPGGINPILTYILKTDADVVVLPEGRDLKVFKPTKIGEVQLDSIYQRYPHIIIGTDITLMSKFPAREIELNDFPEQLYEHNRGQSKVGCYIVNIHGKETAIFGVHMKSLGLTRNDKNLYEDFTKGEGITSREEIKEDKNDIITKVAIANYERARGADALAEAIASLDYPNTIVCGDFNDTPGCYTLQRLEKLGLREVYPLVGIGYMYTFNRDRLLFQIDHILFKGAFRPWSIRREDINISDHYPLITTFIER